MRRASLCASQLTEIRCLQKVLTTPRIRLVIGLGVLLLLAFLPKPVQAQSLTCSNAIAQLQSYAAQVNQVANFEFYQGIQMRCGWNQMCRQMAAQQVNMWYMQEATRVNGWHSQIVQACAAAGGRERRPGRPPAGGSPGQIDESAIEDIKVDDEDKTVRIRIPSNPQGFK